jgi:hypothetical protein
MNSNRAIQIGIASVEGLFKNVEDRDGNGVLSCGDILNDGEVRLVTEKDGSVDFQFGYELNEGDMASFDSLAKTLHDRSGRLVRILKGAGLFAQNAYLAVSYADSTDIEFLSRVGKTGWIGTGDTPDESIDVSRASHAIRETFVPDDLSSSNAETPAEYKKLETTKTTHDKVADKKNDAVKALMDNWFYLDRESLRATRSALAKIEAAQKRLNRLNERLK